MKMPRSVALALCAALGAALAITPAASAEGTETTVAAEEAASSVSIAKIRMFIDDRDYEWIPGPIPEKGEGAFTGPATVASFLDFRPGDSLSPDELGRRCRASQDRLLRSGFFFEAKLEIVPPVKYPERRTIIATLREGFSWRFGAGSAFGLVGQDNACGERRSWRAALGYNLDAVSWRDELAFGLPLIYGLGARFSHNLGDGFVEYLEYSGQAEAGWRAHPDLIFTVSGEAYRREYSGGSERSHFAGTEDGTGIVAWSGIHWDSRQANDGWSSRIMAEDRFGLACFTLSGRPGTGESIPRVEGANAFALSHAGESFGPIELGMQVSFGHAFSRSASVPYSILWDLHSTQDRSVRSGWDRVELQADSFALANTELRIRAASIPFSPIVIMAIAPFAFLDIALASRAGFSYRTFDAFGLGARFGFDNPVFVNFAFAYGWNRDGEGRFTMTGSAGF